MNPEDSNLELIRSKAAKLPMGNLGEASTGVRIQTDGERSADWLELMRLGFPAHYVGASVLDFCSKNATTRALVLFSLASDAVDQVIRSLLQVDGLEVVYAANLELSDIGKSNLIELCYGDKPFFTDSVRTKMTRERFVFGANAMVIFYCVAEDGFDYVSMKTDLRQSLASHTFERRIHGTDGPTDTKFLAEALANPNSLELINRVRVSRNDRVFSRIPENLRDNPNICIDGSSSMELYGLRKSRDLDLICKGSDLRRELLSLGYDVNDGHYKWTPISSDQVIENPYLHVRLYGFKFTSLAVRQLLLSFGSASLGKELSPKKLRDKKYISMYFANTQGKKLSGLGLWGTLATQGRLLFEKAVTSLVPKLPRGIARVLRKLWHSLRSL